MEGRELPLIEPLLKGHNNCSFLPKDLLGGPIDFILPYLPPHHQTDPKESTRTLDNEKA
jgi:hypothetical protein